MNRPLFVLELQIRNILGVQVNSESLGHSYTSIVYVFNIMGLLLFYMLYFHTNIIEAL